MNTVNNAQRYKLNIAYQGHSYFGFQDQPKMKTIQSTLESACQKILREPARITASGRTDTGVHALEQVIHITLTTEKAQSRINKNDFLRKLNSVLPDEMVAHSCTRADTFHARHHAKKKTYVYLILISSAQNPFLEKQVWRLTTPLNLTAMKLAIKTIVGEHDFSAFCASDSNALDKVRRVHSVKIHTKNPAPFFTYSHEKFVCLEFTGSGFLKQMIRNLTGTLVQVGLGKITPNQFVEILKSKNRRQASATAPAQGLYLKTVSYE